MSHVTVNTSEKSVSYWHTTGCNIPEGIHLNSRRRRQNSKSHVVLRKSVVRYSRCCDRWQGGKPMRTYYNFSMLRRQNRSVPSYIDHSPSIRRWQNWQFPRGFYSVTPRTYWDWNSKRRTSDYNGNINRRIYFLDRNLEIYFIQIDNVSRDKKFAFVVKVAWDHGFTQFMFREWLSSIT